MNMNLVPFHRHDLFAHPLSLWDDDFFRPFFAMDRGLGFSGFRVEVKDKEDHYELSAELPGVNREDIEVACDKGMLTISAGIDSHTEDKETLYSERRVGRVRRSFALEGVQEDAITARYDRGVLTVSLPKGEAAGARRIPIQD